MIVRVSWLSANQAPVSFAVARLAHELFLDVALLQVSASELSSIDYVAMIGGESSSCNHGRKLKAHGSFPSLT